MPLKRKGSASPESTAKRARADSTVPNLHLFSPVSVLSSMSEETDVTDDAEMQAVSPAQIPDEIVSPPVDSSTLPLFSPLLFERAQPAETVSQVAIDTEMSTNTPTDAQGDKNAGLPEVLHVASDSDSEDEGAASARTKTRRTRTTRTAKAAHTVPDSAQSPDVVDNNPHKVLPADAPSNPDIVTGVGSDPKSCVAEADLSTDAACNPASVTGVRSNPKSSVAEAAAVRLLAELGVEPGALVGDGLVTLSALIDTITANKALEEVTAKPPTKIIEPATVNAARLSALVVPADSPAEMTAAIAALATLHVPAQRVRGWSAAEMRRLYKLMTWADAQRNTYSIHDGPNDKDWGKPAPFDDTSNVLCLADTSSPITYWGTGEIAAQWWCDSEGMPASRPAVSIQPMSGLTAEFAKEFLNDLCMPIGSSKVADQFGPDQFKASRWMNTRATKGQPAKTHEFKAIYDARKTLKDKSLLHQLGINQLKLHDFVVMEFKVGRYAVKEEGSSDAKGKKKAMERWQSFYDLEAIYKIKDAVALPAVPLAATDFEV